MRFAEIIALQRKDFDFKSNTINICKTWGYTSSFEEGEKKTKTETSNRIIKMDKTLLNIDEISIHGLRHTHASILFYKGISVQYISERLGHADVDTTIRIYTHLIKELREEDEKNTMKILEAL